MLVKSIYSSVSNYNHFLFCTKFTQKMAAVNENYKIIRRLSQWNSLVQPPFIKMENIENIEIIFSCYYFEFVFFLLIFKFSVILCCFYLYLHLIWWYYYIYFKPFFSFIFFADSLFFSFLGLVFVKNEESSSKNYHKK